MRAPESPGRGLAVVGACIALWAVGWPGCASTQQTTGDISSVKEQQGIGPGGLTADEIQSQIMGFADTYAAYVVHAVERVMSGDLSPEERARVYRAQLTSAYGAVTIASSPNSLIAVMDMVVLVTLERMVTEEYWKPSVFGDRALPVLQALQTAEAEIWRLAEQVLWPEQQQELRDLINRWRSDHPDQTIVNTIRLDELSQYRRKIIAVGGKRRSSVFSFFYVDPLANLDPATREIKRTRELTERVFFYSERVPILMMWMARSLYYDLAAADEMKQLMANANSLADVSERYATAIEGYPQVIDEQRDAAVNQIADIIAVERDAAITQFMAGLADQRQAIIDDLRADEERLTGALVDLKQTIEAGTELTSSFDALVARFESDPSEPRGEPFDINDYRAAATDAAEAARELNVLVESVDQLLVTARPGEDESSFAAALDLAETSSARLIDRAFWRALVVVAVLVGGAIAVALIWRLVPRGVAR
jgi:hypothetical protein